MRIRRGTLYLADVSPRHGTEPGKVRPIVVVQSDLLNDSGHPSTWVLPCTTRLVGENLLNLGTTFGVIGAKGCKLIVLCVCHELILKNLYVPALLLGHHFKKLFYGRVVSLIGHFAVKCPAAAFK